MRVTPELRLAGVLSGAGPDLASPPTVGGETSHPMAPSGRTPVPVRGAGRFRWTFMSGVLPQSLCNAMRFLRSPVIRTESSDVEGGCDEGKDDPFRRTDARNGPRGSRPRRRLLRGIRSGGGVCEGDPDEGQARRVSRTGSRGTHGGRASLLVGLALAASAVWAPVPATAKSCSSSYKHAVINGEHKCLRRGQLCQRGADRQYHKYGFHCHKTGKLS